MSPANPPTRLIIADSERNADLFYATRFLAPDPFIFLQHNGRKYLVMSELEIDRAKAKARVDEVLSASDLAKTAKGRGRSADLIGIAEEALRELGATAVEVPVSFGIAHADALRARGIPVTVNPEPFFPERLIKTPEEIAWMTETQRATEAALEQAMELLRASEIRGHELYLANKPLTADHLRTVIHLHLLTTGYLGQHTIVACGRQGCDPHEVGHGPLTAHQPIVFDVFPQSATTRYFADLSRTVVRGRASEQVRRMFEAVREGQEIAFRQLRAGADGQVIHQAILAEFERRGFHTGEEGGRRQGFFHGTGHGVGLEIHEPPRISATGQLLQAGHVVTVEPGLYYTDAGGMRLEDMVVVTETGCRNLTEAPKVLEL